MPGVSFLGLNWPFLPISGNIFMGQGLNWPKLDDFWPSGKRSNSGLLKRQNPFGQLLQDEKKSMITI